jgi:IclR family acetate operon transcriptional repressor
MFLVERGQNGLTARELSQLLGAPRTSVADLLRVLQDRGFVAPTAEGYGWRLDFRVAQLGNAYLHEFSVREVGRTAMRELSRRTGLTTQMAVLDHADIVYIERQDASHRRNEPHVATDIGSRLPAHCTSLGKAMLAFLPDDEIDRLYERPAQLATRTKNTITTLARLRSELAAIRRRGYAVDQEETTPGIVCIGSPILGPDGRPEAAISLAGLSVGMPSAAIESLGRTVARTAGQVSSARGGTRALSRRDTPARHARRAAGPTRGPRARSVRAQGRTRGPQGAEPSRRSARRGASSSRVASDPRGPRRPR